MWISVKDGLPKAPGKYVILYDYKSSITDKIEKYTYISNWHKWKIDERWLTRENTYPDFYNGYVWGGLGVDMAGGVTHWAELPKEE